MAQRNNSNIKVSGTLRDWLLPLIFLFCLPPLGALLAVVQLLGLNSKVKLQASKHDSSTQLSDFPGARTTMSYAAAAQARQKAAAQKEPAALRSLTRKTNRLIGVGAVLALLFGLSSAVILSQKLGVQADTFQLLKQVLSPLCISFGGLGICFAGIRQKKHLRRFRRYLATIGQNKTISVSSLASAAGRPAHVVREDLLDMLDAGCFPIGFLDHGGDKLALPTENLRQKA